jgi:hypothetical protein
MKYIEGHPDGYRESAVGVDTDVSSTNLDYSKQTFIFFA